MKLATCLLLAINFPMVKSATISYTLVLHHEDVDTLDPKTNETWSRLGTFINGTYPGPTLEANLGDEVVVTVINEMPTSATAIHFHGQHQQGTFYFDGVPDVTQCEINPGSSFEYRFKASPAGTFAYHSHMPFQFGDGVFGAFIVRDDPGNDPYADSGVADEIIVALSDWLRYYSDQVYQYTSQFRFDMWPLAHYLSFINGKVMPDPFEYTMTAGETYRLRIYTMGVEYGYRVHLANHTMRVIAADGSYVAPTDVDFLDVYSGERYDVLVEANQPALVYELRARVIDFKGILQDGFTSALFIYSGTSSDGTFVTADAVMVDDFNTSTFTLLDPYALTAYKDDNDNFASTYDPLEGGSEVLADPWTYMSTSYAVVGERQYAFTDSWDFHFAKKAVDMPLLFKEDNDELAACAAEESRELTLSAYSNSSLTKTATIGPRIQFLETNEVIDIVFLNAPTPGNELGSFEAVHPMHLHGHYFHVLASGEGAFDMATANANGNFVDPPERDNIVVKNNSWALVRLKATNPGIWLLHCHSETHLVFGMSTTLVVGDANERPSLPENFPRCGVIDVVDDNDNNDGSAAAFVDWFSPLLWALVVVAVSTAELAVVP